LTVKISYVGVNNHNGCIDIESQQMTQDIAIFTDGENRISLRSFILTQYQYVSDRRTDGHAADS